MRTPPPAIWCIGRNYLEHAREMGQLKASERLTLFMKNPSSVIDDGDPIIIPSACTAHGPQVDYEELAAILGRDIVMRTRRPCWMPSPTMRPPTTSPLDGGRRRCRRTVEPRQDFDTFCPIGRLVPATSVSDPQSLR